MGFPQLYPKSIPNMPPFLQSNDLFFESLQPPTDMYDSRPSPKNLNPPLQSAARAFLKIKFLNIFSWIFNYF